MYEAGPYSIFIFPSIFKVYILRVLLCTSMYEVHVHASPTESINKQSFFEQSNNTISYTALHTIQEGKKMHSQQWVLPCRFQFLACGVMCSKLYCSTAQKKDGSLSSLPALCRFHNVQGVLDLTSLKTAKVLKEVSWKLHIMDDISLVYLSI